MLLTRTRLRAWQGELAVIRRCLDFSGQLDVPPWQTHALLFSESQGGSHGADLCSVGPVEGRRFIAPAL